MKNTEDHIRDMLAERARRVEPGPGPEHLVRAASTRAVQGSTRRWRPVLAAAAVVLVIAIGVIVPTLGGGGRQGPAAPAVSGRSHPERSAAQHSGGLLPATSRFPAAGVCGRMDTSIVTVSIEPDAPKPRCASVAANQRLRVVNRTGDYGQRPRTVTVTWIPDRPFTLRPGESKTVRRPFGDYLAPGVHDLSVGSAYGAEIWLH